VFVHVKQQFSPAFLRKNNACIYFEFISTRFNHGDRLSLINYKLALTSEGVLGLFAAAA